MLWKIWDGKYTVLRPADVAKPHPFEEPGRFPVPLHLDGDLKVVFVVSGDGTDLRYVWITKKSGTGITPVISILGSKWIRLCRMSGCSPVNPERWWVLAGKFGWGDMKEPPEWAFPNGVPPDAYVPVMSTKEKPIPVPTEWNFVKGGAGVPLDIDFSNLELKVMASLAGAKEVGPTAVLQKKAVYAPVKNYSEQAKASEAAFLMATLKDIAPPESMSVWDGALEDWTNGDT